MTVGELRELLAGVSDYLEIVVRAWDDDNDYCGTISGAEVQHDHDEGTPFFAIDCCPDEDGEEGWIRATDRRPAKREGDKASGAASRRVPGDPAGQHRDSRAHLRRRGYVRQAVRRRAGHLDPEAVAEDGERAMSPFDVARELERLQAAYRQAITRRASDARRFAAWLRLSKFVTDHERAIGVFQ